MSLKVSKFKPIRLAEEDLSSVLGGEISSPRSPTSSQTVEEVLKKFIFQVEEEKKKGAASGKSPFEYHAAIIGSSATRLALEKLGRISPSLTQLEGPKLRQPKDVDFALCMSGENDQENLVGMMYKMQDMLHRSQNEYLDPNSSVRLENHQFQSYRFPPFSNQTLPLEISIHAVKSKETPLHFSNTTSFIIPVRLFIDESGSQTLGSVAPREFEVHSMDGNAEEVAQSVLEGKFQSTVFNQNLGRSWFRAVQDFTEGFAYCSKECNLGFYQAEREPKILNRVEKHLEQKQLNLSTRFCFFANALFSSAKAEKDISTSNSKFYLKAWAKKFEETTKDYISEKPSIAVLSEIFTKEPEELLSSLQSSLPRVADRVVLKTQFGSAHLQCFFSDSAVLVPLPESEEERINLISSIPISWSFNEPTLEELSLILEYYNCVSIQLFLDKISEATPALKRSLFNALYENPSKPRLENDLALLKHLFMQRVRSDSIRGNNLAFFEEMLQIDPDWALTAYLGETPIFLEEEIINLRRALSSSSQKAFLRACFVAREKNRVYFDFIISHFLRENSLFLIETFSARELLLFMEKKNTFSLFKEILNKKNFDQISAEAWLCLKELMPGPLFFEKEKLWAQTLLVDLLFSSNSPLLEQQREFIFLLSSKISHQELGFLFIKNPERACLFFERLYAILDITEKNPIFEAYKSFYTQDEIATYIEKTHFFSAEQKVFSCESIVQKRVSDYMGQKKPFPALRLMRCTSSEIFIRQTLPQIVEICHPSKRNQLIEEIASFFPTHFPLLLRDHPEYLRYCLMQEKLKSFSDTEKKALLQSCMKSPSTNQEVIALILESISDIEDLVSKDIPTSSDPKQSLKLLVRNNLSIKKLSNTALFLDLLLLHFTSTEDLLEISPPTKDWIAFLLTETLERVLQEGNRVDLSTFFSYLTSHPLLTILEKETLLCWKKRYFSLLGEKIDFSPEQVKVYLQEAEMEEKAHLLQTVLSQRSFNYSKSKQLIENLEPISDLLPFLRLESGSIINTYSLLEERNEYADFIVDKVSLTESAFIKRIRPFLSEKGTKLLANQIEKKATELLDRGEEKEILEFLELISHADFKDLFTETDLGYSYFVRLFHKGFVEAKGKWKRIDRILKCLLPEKFPLSSEVKSQHTEILLTAYNSFSLHEKEIVKAFSDLEIDQIENFLKKPIISIKTYFLLIRVLFKKLEAEEIDQRLCAVLSTILETLSRQRSPIEKAEVLEGVLSLAFEFDMHRKETYPYSVCAFYLIYLSQMFHGADWEKILQETLKKKPKKETLNRILFIYKWSFPFLTLEEEKMHYNRFNEHFFHHIETFTPSEIFALAKFLWNQGESSHGEYFADAILKTKKKEIHNQEDFEELSFLASLYIPSYLESSNLSFASYYLNKILPLFNAIYAYNPLQTFSWLEKLYENFGNSYLEKFKRGKVFYGHSPDLDFNLNFATLLKQFQGQIQEREMKHQIYLRIEEHLKAILGHPIESMAFTQSTKEFYQQTVNDL